MYRYILAFTFLFGLTSYQQDFIIEPAQSKLEADIPDELVPHFLTFQQEAAKHGLRDTL